MGSERRSFIAVIMAAGSGKRFGGKKQYLEIDGVPMYRRSMEAFAGLADRVVLVVPAEDVEEIRALEQQRAKQAAAEEDRIGGSAPVLPVQVVAGGEERYDSVRAALDALTCDAEDIVMIHDGARPFVTKEVIRRAAEAAVRCGASAPVVPVTDTIRDVNTGAIVDRSRLVAMQTPQCFHYGVLKHAFDVTIDLTGITDDIQVVQMAGGVTPAFTEGSPLNRKITRPEDL